MVASSKSAAGEVKNQLLAAIGELDMGDGIQRLAVPSYFYVTWFNSDPDGPYYVSDPAGAWERLQAAAPIVKFVVLNPASGPGEAISTDWATQIKRAQAAGLKVLGYINTSYGDTQVKSQAQIMAELDKYITWYKIDGVFYDEVAANIELQPYYLELYSQAKSRNLETVVINPGINPHESYMLACDVVVNYEGSASDYAARVPTQWEINYPSHRFWHIIYGVADVSQRDTLLTLTKRRRAGLVYLTTDTGSGDNNPYNTLPADPFWSGMVTKLK